MEIEAPRLQLQTKRLVAIFALVIACWLGEHTAAHARRILQGAGLASFETPADAATAVAYLADWSCAQKALMGGRPPTAFVCQDGLSLNAIEGDVRGRNWHDWPGPVRRMFSRCMELMGKGLRLFASGFGAARF